MLAENFTYCKCMLCLCACYNAIPRTNNSTNNCIRKWRNNDSVNSFYGYFSHQFVLKHNFKKKIISNHWMQQRLIECSDTCKRIECQNQKKSRNLKKNNLHKSSKLWFEIYRLKSSSSLMPLNYPPTSIPKTVNIDDLRFLHQKWRLSPPFIFFTLSPILPYSSLNRFY